MTWLWGEDKKAVAHAECADDVRRRYDNAIRHLLGLLGADEDKGRPSKRRGALEELRKLVEEVVDGRNDLKAKTASLVELLESREAQARRAQGQFDEHTSRLEDEKARLTTRLRTVIAEHAAELENVNASHVAELEAKEAAHAAQLRKENARHVDQLTKVTEDWTTDVGNLRADYENRLEKGREELRNCQNEMRSIDNSWRAHVIRLEQDHRDAMASEAKKYNDAMQKLKAQLMTHGSNDQGWNDTRLNEVFKEIGFDIDVLASIQTFNSLGSSPRPEPNLDPTGFLERNTGREHPPLLLRSQIWKTLKDGFFSLPFGFGSLGPQASHELEKLYLQWQHLLKADECSGKSFPASQMTR